MELIASGILDCASLLIRSGCFNLPTIFLFLLVTGARTDAAFKNCFPDTRPRCLKDVACLASSYVLKQCSISYTSRVVVFTKVSTKLQEGEWDQCEYTYEQTSHKAESYSEMLGASIGRQQQLHRRLSAPFETLMKEIRNNG